MSAIEDDDDISVDYLAEGLEPLHVSRAKRRDSKIEIDAVHTSLSPSHVSPAQLYSTESGRLFHAGKICIVFVGLPARGKTHHSVSLTRYLRWLGVKTHAFHLGDYRRRLSPPNFVVPDDYFLPNASEETKVFRQMVVETCINDIFKFFQEDRGQVGVYDAVNATAAVRRKLRDDFKIRGIQTLFVECISTDEVLVARNIRDVKLSSPDFQGFDYEDAVRHYLRRIELRIPHYEPMSEPDLSYVKIINVAEKLTINNAGQLGYLHNRIIFYLMNARIKNGNIYFARAGQSSSSELSYKDDSSLSEKGKTYAALLKQTLKAHLETRRKERIAHDEANRPKALSVDKIASKELEESPPLVIWSSTRKRTVETANFFTDEPGVEVIQRTQLNQLNPGDVEGMSSDDIQKKYPVEYERQKEDPYHHRYPRSESYHDLSVRLEPLIMEIERSGGDILVIAHESVLRVLYGYLMGSTVTDIPQLDFPLNELVEVTPTAYYNRSERIFIEGLED